MRGPTAFIRESRQALELAQREFERGHLNEAIELLEQALTLGAQDAATHTMLGIACARTHQVERAFEHLERAVELEPEGFAPRCALGELYLRLCVPEQARDHLQRALEYASTREERAYVQGLLRGERARDRQRMYRPSFPKPFRFRRRRRDQED